MSPFFPPSQDLIFFLQGFVCLLTAIFLYWNLERFRSPAQGQYFLAYLVASALHAWMHMILLSRAPGDIYVGILVISQSVTHACLAMAGYRAFVPATARPMVRWLPVGFFVLLTAALVFGLKAFFLTTHAVGGAVALTLGLAGLLRRDVFESRRPRFASGAFLLLILPLAFNTIMPFPVFSDAWGSGLYRQLSMLHLIPEYFELGALIAGMILLHLAATAGGGATRRLRSGLVCTQLRMAMIFLTGIIAAGWILMGQAQKNEDAKERAQILQAIRNGALAFSAREIALLSGSEADANHLTYQRIKGQLQDMRRVNPRSRFLYLMGRRDNQVFFYADSEPVGSPDASPPGQVYADASATLLRVFSQGQEATEGPLPDEWGVWVSGLVPISNGNGVVAVLGMDVDASAWQRMLYRARFSSLTVMWLGCLLILGIFIYMRKTSESALVLTESETKYRRLFEDSADAYFLMKDTYVDCNAAACRLLGLPKEQIVGRVPWDFSPSIQKDGMESRKLAMDYVARARAGEAQAFSWDHQTAAGETLHTEVRVSKLDLVGEACLQIIVRDRTEEVRRLEMEKKVEARLSEIQKWEGLANLAGGVAHDFNNLITSIVGNVHLVQMEGKANPRVAESLDAILESSRLATELARQMLAYAGKSTLSVRAFLLGTQMENMEKVLKAAAGSRARIELSVAPDLPAMLGDPTQIQQVVLNLVINALEAIDRRDGWVRISVDRADFTQEQMQGCIFREPPKPGEYLVLTVRDNGNGIPPDVLSRIFEPFYSTKFTGRGLGLAAVAGIVHNHGGAIAVHSVLRTGTVFEVRLPSTRKAVEAKSFVSGESPVALSPLRVLIAEDEESLLTLARRILERHGHTVFGAVDGEAALALVREHHGSLDLVVADVMMPRMNGLELLTLLKAEFPQLPVLLTSGHVPEQSESAFAKADGFLPKPYHYKDLFRKIHEILQKRR